MNDSDNHTARVNISLAPIDERVIQGVEDEHLGPTERFRQTFEDDENLALFIRRRAQEEGNGDLDVTASVLTVAMEVFAVQKRQTAVNGLNSIFGDRSAKKASTAGMADQELPPAA